MADELNVTATIHTPPPDPQPDRRVVTLTMPYDVAVTLQTLLGWHVYGDPRGTYREHTDAVHAALAPVLPAVSKPSFSGRLDALPFSR